MTTRGDAPSVQMLGDKVSGRLFSPHIATIEAYGYMRGCEQAAQALNKILEHLEDTEERLITIYAAGANGHPTLRPVLEYLRDREPGSVEAQAASLALEHFGTSTLFEIAEFHSKMAPNGKAGKTSGCFIATAVYGYPEAPDIKTLQQFRDRVLLQNQIGSAFVAGYYRLSPPLARLVSRSVLLRAGIRRVLIAPVVRLAEQALERDRRATAARRPRPDSAC